jgi:hypothetical protein
MLAINLLTGAADVGTLVLGDTKGEGLPLLLARRADGGGDKNGVLMDAETEDGGATAGSEGNAASSD